MYLKRLELQGFKSFADKTILEFRPGITTVIGPNGSGKSNISDAIRWVLGEQSMKSLRGSKSEDIIFAGTQARKSLGFADASIVIDNLDGKLPIEYSEVTVTRRIYRNGESGYFINKTPCRLKDVIELFMDTGIGKDGYSIIGQGKIDEILSNKSEDRRNIFEEAAGIVKYRVRKEETEKKLEQTKVNLLRVNDILAEIESSIGSLKEQSEKAKNFLNLRDELKNIEVGLFLYNIDSYKQKIEEGIKDIEIITAQSENETNKLEGIKTQKEKLKTELDEITRKVEELQNIGFESTNQIEKINSDINLSKERISNNNINFESYLKEIELAEAKVEELVEEKTNRTNKKTNLKENKEKFVKELQEKENILLEINKRLSKEETEIELKKKRVEELAELKYAKRENINTSNINVENLGKREKSVKNEIISTISELDSKRMLKSDISQEFSNIETKRENAKKILEEINERKKEQSNKIAKYDKSINDFTSEIRMKDSKLKFLTEMEKEKEGYQKSVKAILLEADRNTGLSKGMHGVLANLISVKKEYEIAIETVLGFTLQNIVTDTEEDAKKMIEYLRKNNLGRASFLPVSSVKGKKVDRLITNGLSGVIGIAADLVKIDKKYEGIILNLLGRTVITEDMETAIILARQNNYSFRIVTLKGDIITPNGAISGGSVVQKTSNLMGRTTQIKDLQKEIEELNVKLRKVTDEKEQYCKEIENFFEEGENANRNLQECEIVYATEKQRVTSIEESIEKLQNTLEKLRQEETQIKNDREQNLKDKENFELEIAKFEKETYELESVIKDFSNRNKENQKYIDDINFEITNLKISVSSFDESNNSIDEMLARVEQDINNNNSIIENRKSQREKILQDNIKLQQDIENYEKQIEIIKQNVSSSSEQIETLKESRTSKNAMLSEMEANIEDTLKIIDDLKIQINKSEVKKSKLEVELEQIVNKMWEDYEITPSMCSEYKKPENVANTTKQVKELRDQIKELGNVNIGAIDEYKQTKERYDFLCEQRLDLETSSNKLRKVIQDMTKTMKEQFEKQFNIINTNFGEVFSELFAGGKAEVRLTDKENILECGIEIEAQPPGKKLQNMNLLSGGEKALTAIALLFAILKINPAPFCVLDEIEAALDDVNVYRFADYLKKFTKHTQFLVITHRKGTMEAADSVYGITMEENGISKLLSMKL